MKKRVFIVLILTVIMLFTLTACSTAQVNKDTEMLPLDKAINLTLDTVGIEIKDAGNLSAELKDDHKVPYYTIDFSYDGAEYHFEVDAYSGNTSITVESKDEVTESAAQKARMINESPEQTLPQDTEIGIEKAKSIALDHAGVNDAVFTQAKKGHDDGKLIYDIEFYANNIEYDYEIDAYSGSIHDVSTDTDDIMKTRMIPEPESAAAASDITVDEAKKIALEHAKVNAENTTFTHVKEGRDDGRKVYEIEFIANGYEFEYEISISGGKILDCEKEKQ